MLSILFCFAFVNTRFIQMSKFASYLNVLSELYNSMNYISMHVVCSVQLFLQYFFNGAFIERDIVRSILAV
jgi:hypothetical protein